MPPRVLHYSDLENAYDTPTRIGRVARTLLERRGPDALLAGSGDNTGPGVLSLATGGRQSLDFFERVGSDVDVVGNHDLDHGPDALRDLVRDAPQQWLLANVSVEGEPFGHEVGVDPTTTVEVGPHAVGVVGVLSPATPEMTPGLDGFAFRDPVSTVVERERELRAADADSVVALAHTSDEDARRIAAETGVDAVLAGHSHERLDEVVDGTPLTRPGATGTTVYELDLGSGAVTRHETTGTAPDGTTVDRLTARVSDAGLDEVVARVDEPLARERDQRPDGEWRLGNFVADAYRWETGADVAIQNAGGIREGPPLSGAVTVGDLVSCSPFAEPVVVAEVSGSELLRVGHESDGRLVDGLADRWWGHVSGMRIEPLPDRKVAFNGGSAAVAVAADEDFGLTLPRPKYRVTVDGTPIEAGETYTVAVPEFLLVTDREFPTLTESKRVERHDSQYEVIVEYARENGIAASIEGRVPGPAGRAGRAERPD